MPKPNTGVQDVLFRRRPGPPHVPVNNLEGVKAEQFHNRVVHDFTFFFLFFSVITEANPRLSVESLECVSHLGRIIHTNHVTQAYRRICRYLCSFFLVFFTSIKKPTRGLLSFIWYERGGMLKKGKE